MNRFWLFTVSFLLFSCHAVDIRETHSYQYQNHPLPENVWSSIDIGVTNTQWLLQHIGPPSFIEKSDGQQTFTYRYEERVKKHTAVFLFYQKQKIDAREKIHSVVLKNNIIVAHSDITPQPPKPHTSQNQPVSDVETAEPAGASRALDSEALSTQPSQGANTESTPHGLPKSLDRDL